MGGTLSLLPAFARSELHKTINRLVPSARRAREQDRLFDEAMGIDTHGSVGLANLSIESRNEGLGFRYQPTPPDDFERLLGMLDLDFSRFAFIDIGSGKGRTLFLAALHPFTEVVGVEFSPELCEIAGRNMASFRHPEQRCRVLKTVCIDAAEFRFPEAPAVVYMYNPFQEAVMAAVVRNLAASLAARPRELYLVYYNALHRRHLDASPDFELVAGGEGPPLLGEPWAIYRFAALARLSPDSVQTNRPATPAQRRAI